MKHDKQKYEAYLDSPVWKMKRAAAIERAEGRCQLCNRGPKPARPLHVHHRTYERLFREADGDLTVLCQKCHNRFHGRDDQGRDRGERRVHVAIAICAALDDGPLRWSQVYARLDVPVSRGEAWGVAKHMIKRGELVQVSGKVCLPGAPRSAPAVAEDDAVLRFERWAAAVDRRAGRR